MSDQPVHDDDDWDDYGPEEDEAAPVTYADAVRELTAVAAERRDVRVDWAGRRGRRGDARIVFHDPGGAEVLRARLRSAADLPAARHLVASCDPIPEHRAFRYRPDGSVKAWLDGGRDDIVLALGRALWREPLRKADMSVHPAAADVWGSLASGGMFEVEDMSSGVRRALRLVAGDASFWFAYAGSTGGDWPVITLEMTGFPTSDAEDARRVLETYGSGYLHSLVATGDVPVRLWSAAYARVAPIRAAAPAAIAFPSRGHDLTPVDLFAAGSGPGRDALEQFVKYYQVLEFFFPRAATTYSASIGKSGYRGVTPSGKQLSVEPGQIEALLRLAVTAQQLEDFLGDSGVLAVASDPALITDVPVLPCAAGGRPTPGYDYRDDVAGRIYKLRGRIVHTKEPGQAGRPPDPPLVPFSR